MRSNRMYSSTTTQRFVSVRNCLALENSRPDTWHVDQPHRDLWRTVAAATFMVGEDRLVEVDSPRLLLKGSDHAELTVDTSALLADTVGTLPVLIGVV